MLKLLQPPRWAHSDARQDLPATVPGWAVAFLALHGDWVRRERVAAVFWPDASTEEALHNLRVNLHRARQVLAAWGVESCLEAERRRVRLNLPTDVAAVRQALAEDRWRDALSLYQRPLFDGMAFPGFPALQEWVEREREDLHASWRATLLRHADNTATQPQDALEAMERLRALDPLDEGAVARQMRALSGGGRALDAAQLYADYARRLADELGAVPSPALQQQAASLPQRRLSAPAVADKPTSRDGFVGREVELAQLRAMLQQPDSRVVTLLGPGGVGKSRLARELTDAHAATFRDGACWVALADGTALDAALAHVAAALNLTLTATEPYGTQVGRALVDSERLVVLDNAEQVSGLGAWLQTQAAAPGVRWLVTSREPLGIARERVFALEGLACPDAGDEPLSIEQARECDAVRLLEARVRALNPRFDLAGQLRPCVALIRSVGGWPLALEVAASALAVQPAATVLADLQQSLDTLAAGQAPQHGRHESVRASLQLSWHLLGSAQRETLAGLSVFKGGCTRVAALAVTQTDGAALAALIERLLVQPAGGGRWTLHPLVAQFAAEMLVDEVDAERVMRGRHAEHYLQRLGQLAGQEQADASFVARAVEDDFENFSAAWQWAVDHRATADLERAVAAWTHFCNAKGRAREVAALIEPALATATAGRETSARLLLALSNARYRAGDIDHASALAEEAAAAADACGDELSRRSALNVLALALVQQGRAAEARRHAATALASARAANAAGEIAQIANTCAIVAKTVGDYEAAAALYEEAVAIHRRRGNHRSLAVALNNLGNVWRARENAAEAQACFEECLRLCDQHGIASTRAFALGNLGLVAYEGGRLDAARRYAQRTLAEPAPEPPMTMAAHALLARIAVDQRRLNDSSDHVRQLALQARRVGQHMAMIEAINCHALVLAAHGQRADAAARLRYVVNHPRVAAMAKTSAAQALEAMRLGDDELAAADDAGALDFDVLVDAAAEAGIGQGTPGASR